MPKAGNASLKRHYQLTPASKLPPVLLNHVLDEYEHLPRYYGYCSNRSRGARKLADHDDDTAAPRSTTTALPTLDARMWPSSPKQQASTTRYDFLSFDH